MKRSPRGDNGPLEMVAGRVRIDYMPGQAALDALAEAQRITPGLRRQELIDRLVIYGLWAMRSQPPPLPGDDRDRWRLPADLRASQASRESSDDSPGAAWSISREGFPAAPPPATPHAR